MDSAIENVAFADSWLSRNRWFVAGAAVILLGVLVYVVL